MPCPSSQRWSPCRAAYVSDRQAFGRSRWPLVVTPIPHATVHGGRRDAQREAARLVNEASQGRIPLTNEAFGGLLAEELGAKDLRQLKASDLDAFYDRLSQRDLSATSVRRCHAVCSAALNQGVMWGLLQRSTCSFVARESSTLW
jgi:hypothetical protein